MKKKHLFLSLTLVLIGQIIFAQDINLSNRLIQQYEEKKQKAMSKTATIHDHLWFTPLLHEAVLNWDSLTDEAKEIFSKAKSRPTFVGTEEILTYESFALHYTLDGPADESIAPTDENENGYPDYAEKMLYIFQKVYEKYHTTDKYTVPPSDGDEYYDIYVSGKEAGPGVYGYVSPESNIGDNLNSSDLTETDAYTSHMVMRNNYDGFGSGDVPIEVTAAHEYMHAIQNGYSAYIAAWFMEATATWAEDHVYPGHDDNLQYIKHIFKYPDVALNIKNGAAGGTFDGHWYGAWIFFKYMVEHTGSSVIKNIYRKSITYYEETAIDMELKSNWNSSFLKIYGQFVIANTLMTSDSKYSPYTYSRASIYNSYIKGHGGYKTERTINFTGKDINHNSAADGNNRLMPLSYDVFPINTKKDFKVQLTSQTDDEIGLILVKKNTTTGKFKIQFPEQTNESVIDVRDQEDFNSLQLLVARFDSGEKNFNSANYSLLFTKTATSPINDMLATDYKIYPNPANNYINIVNPNATQAKVVIINVLNEEIITKNITEENKINTEKLNNGIYFLTIYNNNQKIKTEKIIITH